MAKGRDFRQVLGERLATSGVLLAVIGRDWLHAADDDGKRRLGDPKDFVRLEIAAALKRDIPVVPVLVREARMPRAEDLPEDLKDLVFRDGVELTHARWDSDLEQLVTALVPYVDTPRSGLRRLSWRVPAAVAGIAVVGIAGYFGYQAYQERNLKEAEIARAAVEERVAAETRAKAEAALRGGTVDRPKVARPTPAEPVTEPKLHPGGGATATPGYARLIQSKESGDTFRVVQVSPPLDTKLQAGTPTEFKFRVRYDLQSRDKAVFVVSIAQTSLRATGCSDHAGGQLIDSNQATIARGRGEVELGVLWHGGLTKSGPQPKGYLYPAPSLWSFPNAGDRISVLEDLPEACWQFE